MQLNIDRVQELSRRKKWISIRCESWVCRELPEVQIKTFKLSYQNKGALIRNVNEEIWASSLRRSGPSLPSQPWAPLFPRFTARRVSAQVCELQQICELPARCSGFEQSGCWSQSINPTHLRWRAQASLHGRLIAELCPWRNSSRLHIYKDVWLFYSV